MKPRESDVKEWKYALERAEKARQYAETMPSFVKDSDLKFQDPVWQWEHETKGKIVKDLGIKEPQSGVTHHRQADI